MLFFFFANIQFSNNINIYMMLIFKFIYEKSSNLSMKNIPYNQLYQRVSNLPTMDITC